MHGLVFVGDFPLPGASPENTGVAQGQKRSRDSEDPPDTISSGDRVAVSSSSTDYGGGHGSRSQSYSSGSAYTSSGAHEHAHLSSLPLGHNSELSGVTYSGIKPDPLIYEQLQLQSNANLYPENRGQSYKSRDPQGSSQGPSQGPPQGPPLASQQPQPAVGEFQYDPEAVLRSLSFDQRGSLSQGPQSSSQGPAQVPQADDVLTALDAVYHGGSSSINSEPMGNTQHAFDMWGSAPGGFQCVHFPPSCYYYVWRLD